MTGGDHPPAIVFVTHRFEHHAEPSGYDRVLERIPGRRLRSDLLLRLTRPLPDRLFGWLRNGGLYRRYHFVHELRAAAPFLLGSRRVFHFAYADNGYRYLGRLPNLHDHRIVATFHRPATVLESCFRDPRPITRLDHAILLGESQRAFFRRHLDDSRVTCIPYGVDIEFFCPGDEPRDRRRCLFVGHYLRDFETLRTTVRLLAARLPDVSVSVVTRPRFAAGLAGLPNTEVRSEISDVELRALYRSSAVLLLPLLDAVANTTILEAIACGLPVVTSDVGSVGEYLTPACSVTVPPGEPVRLAEATAALLEDTDRRERAGREARRLAEARFDMRRIAAWTHEVLLEVARRPGRR